MTLLSARGLTRRFGGLRVLNGVDLDLREGRVRALIGPNGSGKTTLINLLAGRLRPGAGRILFAGADITALPAHRRMRRGMAYGFQITSVFPHLTVRENVALAVMRVVKGGAARRRETAAALRRVGLSAAADQPAGEVSYGHQRLLEIAMCLGQKPRLLMLDEPTQGLGAADIDRFRRLVEALRRECALLLVEHNMELVMRIADDITVLNNGRVLAEGPPEAIRADPAVQTAYLGAR